MLKLKFKTTNKTIGIIERCKINVSGRDSEGNTWNSDINVNPNDLDIILNKDSISKDNIDWEQRRYEIAKEMLHAIYIDNGNAERENDFGLPFEFKTLGNSAKEAVRFADALIKELKKNNNEKV